MKASDIMSSRVVTVRADTSIAEAVRLMLQNRISGLPVVDAGNRLVGIVTEGDFLRRAETGGVARRPRWLEFLVGPGRLAADYVRSHGRQVAEVMTTDVATVSETAPLGEIVDLLDRRHIKRVPVVRDGRVVGIVSRANLVQALGRVVAEIKPMAASDRDIRGHILDELKNQPWAPSLSINVIVRDGVVDLNGVITDERQRGAMRVAVENIPGVREVKDHLVWVEPLSGFVMEPPAAIEAAPPARA